MAAATTANTGNSAERKHFKPSRHIQTHFEQKIKKKKHSVFLESVQQVCLPMVLLPQRYQRHYRFFCIYFFIWRGGAALGSSCKFNRDTLSPPTHHHIHGHIVHLLNTIMQKDSQKKKEFLCIQSHSPFLPVTLGLTPADLSLY